MTYTLEDLLADPVRLAELDEAEQTSELCLAVLTQAGWALRYVKRQTPELCLAAVTSSCWAIQHAYYQTPEVCRTALEGNATCLRFIRTQTEEQCIQAMAQQGTALQYVHNQTPAICRAALMENVLALRYVKQQSRVLCQLAVRGNPAALQHVRLPIDRLMDPYSGQFADWVDVVTGCDRFDIKTFTAVMNQFVSQIPVRKSSADEWLQCVPGQKTMIEHLTQLTDHLRIKAWQYESVRSFVVRVDRLVEEVLTHRWHGGHRLPAESRTTGRDSARMDHSLDIL